VHTQLVLIVLAATIFVALSQVEWQRPATLRRPTAPSRSRAPEEPERPPAGSGLAGLLGWAGMAVATLACLGHFVAPVADPLWLALIAAAILTALAALLAPRLQARSRRRNRRWRAPRGAIPAYQEPGERRQRRDGSSAE
jgi:Flp pilus assembly protein TadB